MCCAEENVIKESVLLPNVKGISFSHIQSYTAGSDEIEMGREFCAGNVPGLSRSWQGIFFPLLVQNGEVLKWYITQLLEMMAAVEIPQYRPINMSSPSCSNWTRDSGLGPGPRRQTCGNVLLNTPLLVRWDRRLTESERERECSDAAHMGFQISNWKQSRICNYRGLPETDGCQCPKLNINVTAWEYRLGNVWSQIKSHTMTKMILNVMHPLGEFSVNYKCL